MRGYETKVKQAYEQEYERNIVRRKTREEEGERRKGGRVNRRIGYKRI